AGQGPSPSGTLSAAGQVPSSVAISTVRCIVRTSLIVSVRYPTIPERCTWPWLLLRLAAPVR
ncbi:MAG: hypothetical protein ABSD97_14260, partial [Acidimicrobiales bacterium]